MKSSRYLLEIIIYPSINFIIPSIVPSMQEFFLSLLSIGGGDSDGSALDTYILWIIPFLKRIEDEK